jgi:hypothetical protein
MSKPDESALKRDYCAGVLSIQKVADKHSVAKSTLSDMAKKFGWQRPKKPSKNSVQNTSGRSDGRMDGREISRQKNSEKIPSTLSIAGSTFDPAEFGISEQLGLFAEYVAAGKKLTEAYRLAGYKGEGGTANSNASRMLRNARVSRAVRWLRDRRQQRLALTETEIIHQLSSIASMDPNDISQLRRVNCRYCWGDDHHYQWRDIDEHQKACKIALKDEKPPPGMAGGIGFVESAVPNEDCPRCGGEGTMQTFWADTTMLDGPARWGYLGVKETMNGLEIKMASPEAARRELLRLLLASKQNTPPLDTSMNIDEFRQARKEMLDDDDC